MESKKSHSTSKKCIKLGLWKSMCYVLTNLVCFFLGPNIMSYNTAAMTIGSAGEDLTTSGLGYSAACCPSSSDYESGYSSTTVYTGGYEQCCTDSYWRSPNMYYNHPAGKKSLKRRHTY